MTDTSRPRRRWVLPLLGLSLALNLLIVGMAAGAFWRFKDMGFDKARGGGPAGITYLRALDPEDRKAVLQELRSMRETGRAKEIENRNAIMMALRADPFEPDQLQALADSRLAQGQATKAAIDTKWLAVVSGMSPTERAAYSDRLQQAFDRRQKRNARRRGD